MNNFVIQSHSGYDGDYINIYYLAPYTYEAILKARKSYEHQLDEFHRWEFENKEDIEFTMKLRADDANTKKKLKRAKLVDQINSLQKKLDKIDDTKS